MSKVCIIDYNSGNIQSVKAALDILNIDYVVSNQDEKINESSHLILPGVGSYKAAMLKLSSNVNLQNLSNQVLKKKKPILGICVGMQIFSSFGYEFFKTKGLAPLCTRAERGGRAYSSMASVEQPARDGARAAARRRPMEAKFATTLAATLCTPPVGWMRLSDLECLSCSARRMAAS